MLVAASSNEIQCSHRLKETSQQGIRHYRQYYYYNMIMFRHSIVVFLEMGRATGPWVKPTTLYS